MTGKDLQIYIRYFPEWATGREDVKRVLVVNPDAAQDSLFRGLFPNAHVECLHYPIVDLSCTMKQGRFDVMFISNTLMCSPDPGKWIENALGAATEVWVQELVRAHRNGAHELSPETGDVCRFTFPQRGEESRVPGYDIDADPRFSVERIEFYSDLPEEGPTNCRKFIAIIRKKLEDARTARGGADLPAPVQKTSGVDDSVSGSTPRRRPLPG